MLVIWIVGGFYFNLCCLFFLIYFLHFKLEGTFTIRKNTTATLRNHQVLYVEGRTLICFAILLYRQGVFFKKVILTTYTSETYSQLLPLRVFLFSRSLSSMWLFFYPKEILLCSKLNLKGPPPPFLSFLKLKKTRVMFLKFSVDEI